MTDGPRDTSVLIRANVARTSQGLPRAILAAGLMLSVIQPLWGWKYLAGALVTAIGCALMAAMIVLWRQLYALTEISSVGIHKAGLEWDLGFRTWKECAAIHTLWFRPYWYLGRNLLWSVLTRAYVPKPQLLDDNNVRLLYEAVRQFAPENHPLLAKLRANRRVREVVSDID